MTTTWQVWIADNAQALKGKLSHMAAAPWDPTEDDQKAAWLLYNELQTRITAERLHYRAGDEASALDSLHDLFQLARGTINQYGAKARHFAIFARILLNKYLRPFTSKWHRERLRGQLDRQDNRRIFRQELLELQEKLVDVIQVFGKLAEGNQYVLECDKTSPTHCFDANRIWPTKFLGPSAEPEVLKSELEMINERRKARYKSVGEKKHGGLGFADNNNEESVGTFGLAISGGGIRSATFALGVLQKLADERILKDVDYLSTVSGGGYVGAFLSSNLLADQELDSRKLLVRESPEVETAPVRWLRNHSKAMKGGGYILTLLELTFQLTRIVVLRTAVAIIAAIVLCGGWQIVSDRSAFDFHNLLQSTAFTITWIVFLTLCLLLLDTNKLSLRPLYRRRLSEAYIWPKQDRSPKLSELAAALNAPYHLICAAVNLPNSKNDELRGRKSDFFVFSPKYCGSVLTGYRQTSDIEECDPELDLATAMAISGAAASTHAGTWFQRSWYLRLFLWCVRLSYWMPNPLHIKQTDTNADDGKKIPLRPWFRPRLWRFVPELLGLFSEEHKYINVSDGGHIENLGVYELLRRRCKFILCIDGECDPRQQCGGLVKACRFASIDLGIHVDIDLTELHVDDSGFSQSHAALGTINYNCLPDGNDEVGYLLYLKLSMTGNERNYIHEYRQRRKTFPHESTIDQFYDEDQFEAYRALGNHVAEDLFRTELVGKLNKKEFRTKEWVQQLVASLEPPTPKRSRV